MELSEIAENRAREFANTLMQEILAHLPLPSKSSIGIFTSLKLLAERTPIPELQLLLFIAEHQPVKKSQVVKEFQEKLGYSSIYRKINKLVTRGILADHENDLALTTEYHALALMATISNQIQHERSI